MLAVVLGLTLGVALPAAKARPASPNHDDALKARARGEIRSLEQILESVKVNKYDRLVNVEIARHDDLWIYEITWLTKTGRFRSATIDAARGIILKDQIK